MANLTGLKKGGGLELRYNPGDWLEFLARSDADPSAGGQPDSSVVETQRSEAAETTRRKPIVSINGRDVDESELEPDAA